MVEEVIWSQFIEYIFLDPAYWVGNALAAIFFLLGIIFIASAIKRQLGKGALKTPIRVWVASGFVFVFLHEIPEIAVISGLHGGFPSTVYGSLHILVMQSLSGILYLAGSIMIYRKMKEMM